MNEKKLMEFVDSLFSNGMRPKADRFILVEENHPGSAKVMNARDLGGWSRLPIRDRVRDYAATVEREARATAFRDMTLLIQSLRTQGTMNYRRGYEEGVRDALRTLEAAAVSAKNNNEPNET